MLEQPLATRRTTSRSAVAPEQHHITPARFPSGTIRNVNIRTVTKVLSDKELNDYRVWLDRSRWLRALVDAFHRLTFQIVEKWHDRVDDPDHAHTTRHVVPRSTSPLAIANTRDSGKSGTVHSSASPSERHPVHTRAGNTLHLIGIRQDDNWPIVAKTRCRPHHQRRHSGAGNRSRLAVPLILVLVKN